MNNPIRAALIGCGSISPMHLNALSELADVTVTAVCDIAPERARAAAAQFGATAYTDWKKMIADGVADVIHICTPHYLHADMAVAALESGAWCLCEKPVATTNEDARRITDADKSHRLGVCFQNRYNAASRMLRQLVDEGDLGALRGLRGSVVWSRDAAYYASGEWRGKMATEGGGVLINQAIHTLDLMLWIGGEVADVRGCVSTDLLYDEIEVEDSAHLRVQFQSGISGVFYATNAYVTDNPVELELTFDSGARLILRGDCLTLEKDGMSRVLSLPEEVNLGKKSYWGNGHKRLIADFYEHVRENQPFWIDGAVGATALKVLLSVY